MTITCVEKKYGFDIIEVTNYSYIHQDQLRALLSSRGYDTSTYSSIVFKYDGRLFSGFVKVKSIPESLELDLAS